MHAKYIIANCLVAADMRWWEAAADVKEWRLQSFGFLSNQAAFKGHPALEPREAQVIVEGLVNLKVKLRGSLKEHWLRGELQLIDSKLSLRGRPPWSHLNGSIKKMPEVNKQMQMHQQQQLQHDQSRTLDKHLFLVMKCPKCGEWRHQRS